MLIGSFNANKPLLIPLLLIVTAVLYLPAILHPELFTVITDSAPLSKWLLPAIYWNHYVAMGVGMILVIIQALLINRLLNRIKFFQRINFVPALMYVVVSGMFVDFLMPGLLGEQQRFARLYRVPIEKAGDSERATLLARRIAPFLLRRTKAEVVSELPPKSEILRTIELEGSQRDLYETVRLAVSDEVQGAIHSRGQGRSQIQILDALLKLRQVCCDPRLVKLEAARQVQHSAKLAYLSELLPTLIAEGRRILLFSQFVEMLGLIAAELDAMNIPYLKLTGSSRNREQLVERFQQGVAPLFLISLKAGGVGLNLTAADTVIHYDPWWNPAVENQATDRAHRIGQDKPVFVYKLVTAGTVEEQIMAMQARKQALADGIHSAAGDLASLNDQDLLALLQPLADE